MEKFLEAIMDTIEVDQEKKLSFAEFLVIMVKRNGVNGVQNAFLSQDKDRSGSISRDELKVIIFPFEKVNVFERNG